MKRIISLLFCLVAMAGLLSSCNSSDPVVLFFAVEDSAGSFDPQIVSDATASIVVRNCFEGLLRRNENGEVINGVAESWSVSEDGLKYTFKLREDAVWHLTSNAKEQLGEKLPENFDLSVTAYDFQFALRRAVDPGTGAPLSYMLYNIENAPEILDGRKAPEELGVRVIDKYTLEITLSQPQSNFSEVLTEPVCMPCNETFFKGCTGRYGTLIAFSLSNGPFYLSRFDETSYRINKAADYCGDSVAVPDYVWLYVVDTEEKLLEVLETDDYSGGIVKAETYEKLKVSRKMTVTETANTVKGFIMNLSDPVMGEENIRKALLAATDTGAVAKNMNKEQAKGIIPPVIEKTEVNHPVAYSEEKAQVYLKNGLGKLEASKIDISVLCEKKDEDTVRRVMQEWQRILGISVNFSVKTAEKDKLLQAVESGNYQVALYNLRSETDEAYEYFGSFTSGSPKNVTKFDGFGMEELIGKLYSADEKVFLSVYSSIESKLYSASLIIPVCNENTYFVCTENVRGVIYFSGNDKLYFHKATNVK